MSPGDLADAEISIRLGAASPLLPVTPMRTVRWRNNPTVRRGFGNGLVLPELESLIRHCFDFRISTIAIGVAAVGEPDHTWRPDHIVWR